MFLKVPYRGNIVSVVLFCFLFPLFVWLMENVFLDACLALLISLFIAWVIGMLFPKAFDADLDELNESIPA